jgi:hypothetical protein
VSPQNKFFCLLICCRANVFTVSLHSKGCLFWRQYSGFQSTCHIAFESCRKQFFLLGPCNIKYSIYRGRKVGEIFFPKLPVSVCVNVLQRVSLNLKTATAKSFLENSERKIFQQNRSRCKDNIECIRNKLVMRISTKLIWIRIGSNTELS